jgi:Transmembrane protein 43
MSCGLETLTESSFLAVCPMSKRTNPLVAAFFGILLVPGSVCLQAWNEYRTIHRTRGLEEAAEIVVSLPDPEMVQTELDGKLVHLAGGASTTEVLRDPKFAMEQNAISFRRRVEMYQWEETEETKDGRKTYKHRQVWKEGRIDSDRFQQTGYSNPFPAFESWASTAKDVMVGKYELSDSLKSQKNDVVPTAIDAEAIKSNWTVLYSNAL